ncbi:MAG: DNA polymerase III subunit gamma/tau [Dehalococcoidia bacterium]|nr:DNA polymerase III subunit gamma/tau [Dehalococcoidia bacterium]
MLYGKYRPAGFDEVVGQDHVVTTLRNALRTGQVAHGYLFAGPRGTGKTTTARILAKAVNCANLKDGDPCGACSGCIAIANGSALDLIEMDAASNRGIDDIRELRERAAFAPSDLARKVYLLDEVHMLTDAAFNALLKTLEEPPKHRSLDGRDLSPIFILATTDLHNVPATIISRCQRFDFHRVQNEAIVRRLQFVCEGEGISVPEEGLLRIAIRSRGGMRDAITLLEQVAARYGRQPSLDDVLEALGLVHDPRSEQLARALVDDDLATGLDIARSVADDGIDIARFTRETVDILREILPQVVRGRIDETGSHRELATTAKELPGVVPKLLGAIEQLAKADFRLDPSSPVPLEVAIGAAIVGPLVAPVAAAGAVPAGAPAGRQQGRAAAGRPAQGSGDSGGTAPASQEERFLKNLYEHCKMANGRLAAWLNGSCRVVSLAEGELELGFFMPMHMQKVDTDCRQLVEQQAETLLGRPVTLKVSLLEKDQPQASRSARKGHLVEAARAIPGAIPVGKEQ